VVHVLCRQLLTTRSFWCDDRLAACPLGLREEVGGK
jgi:hypothetical protein